jgi:hypothetical protein
MQRVFTDKTNPCLSVKSVSSVCYMPLIASNFLCGALCEIFITQRNTECAEKTFVFRGFVGKQLFRVVFLGGFPQLVHFCEGHVF